MFTCQFESTHPLDGDEHDEAVHASLLNATVCYTAAVNWIAARQVDSE